MKIAMITSAQLPPEEGVGSYVFNLSKHLVSRGHEVVIFTRGSYKYGVKVCDELPIELIPYFPIYPLNIKLHELYLDKILRRLEDSFDILHIHCPLTPVPNLKKPLIATMHSSMVGNSDNLELTNARALAIKLATKTVTVPIIKKIFQRCSAVTTVSDQVSNELKTYFGYDRAITLGNGVDTDQFKPDVTENIKDYILYAGRLGNGKGIFELLNAYHSIAKNNDVRLLLCGKGELENDIKRWIKHNGHSDDIILVGQVSHDKMVDYYGRALLFAFPSHYEGMPTVLLEAMSCGLPVIASNIPAHRLIVQDRKNGILFERGDSQDLANKIDELIRSPVLRKSLGNCAHLTIDQNYSWKFISKKYEDVYNRIIT